ncbi:MAG: bifunctional DNA-formamidopyrimidine glycosylase/DNA-(apurinic or apyrimidinic site) lyase [Patescibacteria group bacterium]
MPELPEVQTTASKLNELLPGLKIIDVWSDYFSSLYVGKDQIKNKKYFSDFKKSVIGSKVISVSRRAKNVLIHLSSGKTILVHMKMTGHLLYGSYSERKTIKKNQESKIPEVWLKEKWVPNENKESLLWDSYNRFIHLVFSLSNGKSLVLSDVRKFAKVAIFESLNHEESKHLRHLGPEPLEENFTFSIFKGRILKKPKGKIKTVLMDQEILAGVGNIYSDEVLFEAGIHPESVVSKIPESMLQDIFKSIKILLNKGINFRGDSMSDYRMPNGEKGEFQNHHKVYRKTGAKCPKKNCGGIISRIKVGGRSGHFCPKHQKKFV